MKRSLLVLALLMCPALLSMQKVKNAGKWVADSKAGHAVGWCYNKGGAAVGWSFDKAGNGCTWVAGSKAGRAVGWSYRKLGPEYVVGKTCNAAKWGHNSFVNNEAKINVRTTSRNVVLVAGTLYAACVLRDYLRNRAHAHDAQNAAPADLNHAD